MRVPRIRSLRDTCQEQPVEAVFGNNFVAMKAWKMTSHEFATAGCA